MTPNAYNTSTELTMPPVTPVKPVTLKTITLADDVVLVLRRSTINDNALVLPGQLTLDLYTRVDKALRAAGGKWNRRLRAHVFDGPPGERLGLDTGVVVDRKQTFQVFETPPELATRMARILRLSLRPGARVLEPSAGSGSLVQAAVAEGYLVEAVEIRRECFDALDAVGTPESTHMHDFLTLVPDKGDRSLHNFAGQFDGVLMNPPFAGGQDIDHVTHAIDFLRPGGALVAIMSGNVPDARGRKASDFRYLVAKHGGHFEALPPSTFKESGTNVSTVLLTLWKSQEPTP